jgi:hypothetical protein
MYKLPNIIVPVRLYSGGKLTMSVATMINEDSQQYLEECNHILKLIINKVYYARVDEKVIITSLLEGYMEVEQGDFVDLFIESK